MPPSAKERMASLEAYQEQNMKEHKEIKDALKENSDKLDQLLEKLENKFAAKRVEIAVKGGIGIVVAYVIYYVLDRTLKGL